MAKLRKVGQAIVLTSGLKAEEINRAQKFAPKALQLFDKDKVVFAITAGGCSGSIGNHGVVFNSENAAGYAEITDFTRLVEKDEVMEEYAVPLSKVLMIEKQVADALDEVNALFEEVKNNVEVE